MTRAEYLRQLGNWFQAQYDFARQRQRTSIEFRMSTDEVSRIASRLNSIADVLAPEVKPGNCNKPMQHAPGCDCGSL